MELYLLPLTLFLLSIIILLLFHDKRKTNINPAAAKLPLPPGSSGWPIVGESLTYLSMAKKGLQYRFITDRVKRYSSPNIFKTSLLGETMAILCTPEGNKFLFSNENKLVQAWWPASLQKIFSASEEVKVFSDHTRQLRRQVIPSFLKPQYIQNYVSVLDSMNKQHMKQYWRGKQVVRVQELARHHAFGVACRLFLSIEDVFLIEKLEKLAKDMSSGMTSLPVNFPVTKYRRALKSSRVFHKELLDIIKLRKETMNIGVVGEQEDLLSFLLRFRGENGEFLNERDIGDKVLTFIFPAHDTTSMAIVAIVNYLAELPHVYNQVWEEQMKIASSKGEEELLKWEDMQKMTYSWNMAREVLRLMPPGFGAFREVITDFNYQGFFIPKGWKLHWNMYATHMNPKYFPIPEKFDPTRFEGSGPIPYAYVPFGGGPRMCPGAEFARLQILTFMHNLISKYKFEKVFLDEKLVCDPAPTATRGLPIRLYPQRPLSVL